MKNRWLLYILFILNIPILLSCEDCGPTDEPSLILNIQSSTPFSIDTLYGVGATRRPTFNTSQYISSLPINLTADSTRYNIVINKHLESITIFYQRDFHYRNQHCGYVIDLYAPLGQRARTSRGQVNGVSYTQNSYNGGFLRPATSVTGIQVTLTL